MCLILFAAGAHSNYPLIVAANRDEAHSRPAARAGFWMDHPSVYGGRDLEKGGTWLAISRNGRFAAITNYRGAIRRVDSTRSRGELTRDYLTGSEEIEPYLERVSRRADEYNGFSLIAGELDRLWFFSNQRAGIQSITQDVHGLSNHLLDEPWPKVKRGTAVLKALLHAPEADLVPSLFDILADREPAPDEQLSAADIALERRNRSAVFIADDRYGTRASTVLLVSADGKVLFCERTYGPGGVPLGHSERRFELERTLTRS